MAIFMLYEGIEGEHALNEAAGHIKLESLSWGMSRASSSVRPGQRSRIEPSVAEVTLHKEVDGSSIALLTEGLTGKFDRTVTLSVTRQGKGQLLPFLVYTLYDAGITGMTQSAPPEGTPSESLSLNFTSIDIKYIKYGDELTGTPSNVLYSIPHAS